jgi:hypothetical protein
MKKIFEPKKIDPKKLIQIWIHIIFEPYEENILTHNIQHINIL